MAKNNLQPRSVRKQKLITNSVVHVFLAIMAVIWLLPLFYILMHSFRGEKGQFVSYFMPKLSDLTLDNYKALFTDRSIMCFSCRKAPRSLL